ncbi:hypothetical protein RJ639_041454 [Escallonia herrerae]|uniref:Cytochrome P450 n=1 Tax=Escallonia herrerae TaxID=1293975 RepID=A0AA88WFC7_9ASTE|nr:hypothetical protein RJ639_041454 [Escallonia herrerae]
MLQFPSIPVLFTFLLFFTLVLRKWMKPQAGNLPPGPMKLPIIGNLLQMASIGSVSPHVGLNDLSKKYGPIMHLQLGEGSAIVVSSPEAAEQVLKKHELVFAQRPNFFANEVAGYGHSGLFFAPNDDSWRQFRKICTMELLGAKQVRSFKSVREEEVEKLVVSIASSSGTSINLSEKILETTNSIISRAAFGNKCRGADDFRESLKDGNECASGFDLPDLFPSLKFLPLFSRTKPILERVKQRMDTCLGNIIVDHRAKRDLHGDAEGEEDVVDVLLRLQESNDLSYPITTTNIKAILMDIFAGGTDTTATTVEWAMAELLKNPKEMAKAQAEVRQILKGKIKIREEDTDKLRVLKLIVRETLRLHPPGALMPRESKEECEINGFLIPRKTKAFINLWAIGRDPRHWDNPDCFVPERFEESSVTYMGANFEYLPYGTGRRICPGIAFGIITIELQLATMLYHFNWRLADGIKPEELDMTEAFGFTVKRRHPLNVIATPLSIA